MIIFIFIASVFALALLEILSLRKDRGSLQVSASSDMELSEPGEIFHLYYSVKNTSFLPRLYAGLSLYLDGHADIREDSGWMEKHVIRDNLGTRVSWKQFLLPHRVVRGKIALSFRERGVFSPGRFYLETGDLLGFRSRVESMEVPFQMICTAKLCEDPPVLRTLGGILGEISVRRFIHEDPTLQLSYHDYTGTEPMKQISWLQTARLNRLTVRTEDHTTDADIALILNMFHSRAESMEKCFEILRTAAEMMEQQGLPYAIYTNGDLRIIRRGLGRPHLYLLLKRIGSSKRAAYTALTGLVHDILMERSVSRSYILIAEEWDDPVREAVRLLTPYSSSEIPVLTPSSIKAEHSVPGKEDA